MRYTEILPAWTAATPGEEAQPLTLPLRRKQAETPETLTFSCTFRVPFQESSTVFFLELRALSGVCRVALDGREIGVSDTLYTGAVFELTPCITRQEQTLTLTVTPRFTPAGEFIFGGAALIGTAGSHFLFEDGGMRMRATFENDGAQLEVDAPVAQPNNYDVLIFRLLFNGIPVQERTARPTAPKVRFDIGPDLLWDGAHAPRLSVEASLRRDSDVLDRVVSDAAVREICVSDEGYFCMGGVREPLNGVLIPDPAMLEKEMERIEALGANFLILPWFDAIDENDLYLCDVAGLHVLLRFPYEDPARDLEEIARLLPVLRRHPSVAFLQYNAPGSEAARRFTALLRTRAPGLLSAAKQIEDAIDADAAIFETGVPASPEALLSLETAFEAGEKTSPPRIVLASLPPTEQADDFAARLHEELWFSLGKRRGCLGYAAGALSSENGTPALTAADGSEKTDAFWFFRTQFSDEATLKLCALPAVCARGETLRIRCYTNVPPVTLTLNGKEKKRVRCTRLHPGVYCFDSVKPDGKNNIIVVRAGDLTDSAAIRKE